MENRTRFNIEFALQFRDSKDAQKAGQPYLVFWIKDGKERLYPKQRSKGVRWFLSFYLQLRASALSSPEQGHVFLIDEPGGSLHSKAQEDVLKVFEDNKKKIQIIYTTHSPYLIKLETLYRLLAVQRDDDDNSQTKVMDINSLGGASRDTLSPIYTLMGANFSDQQVIQKNHNVLLEEISAFYYLKAFWKLTNSTKDPHFLPATGVNNIPLMAYLFLGWNVNFLVLVDDEPSGRKVFNELKQNLFANDDEKAKKALLKIDGKKGIEDIFSVDDFKKWILGNETEIVQAPNSEFIKQKGESKAICALNFMLKVNEGQLKFDSLEKQTQEDIKNLVFEN